MFSSITSIYCPNNVGREMRDGCNRVSAVLISRFVDSIIFMLLNFFVRFFDYFCYNGDLSGQIEIKTVANLLVLMAHHYYL